MVNLVCEGKRYTIDFIRLAVGGQLSDNDKFNWTLCRLSYLKA